MQIPVSRRSEEMKDIIEEDIPEKIEEDPVQAICQTQLPSDVQGEFKLNMIL